ncbi:hypothetical protein [Dokdonella ginsengisoli]|uniref:Uncharacterized protein n=1 Tax=Dokdonella ginsengisoli TaxID=363846 RepID=A0ABV9QTN9_9GAMM
MSLACPGQDSVGAARTARERPGFVRATASDRPGVAQPVPEREIPLQPWPRILAMATMLTLLALGAWEWRMRTLQLMPGDLGDYASGWAEQRRRIDSEDVPVAIVGDSRILFDTDLARFEALTGVRPLQLALVGTNARPFLENLADALNFRGLAVVGIAETSYFRRETGLRADALKLYRYESPAQRSAFLLHRALSRVFGFLDEEYRLSRLVRRLDPDLRAGADGPYGEVWKIISTTDQRQSGMWTRIESDERLREHARLAFERSRMRTGPPVADDVVAMTLEATRAAVAKIRARGGDVVFVRPPSTGPLRAGEDRRLPRARGWEALLAAAAVRGIHADDVPQAQGLTLPENSHLTRACATVFTDAYVRRLANLTARLPLRADAPPALQPADCVAAGAVAAAPPSP